MTRSGWNTLRAALRARHLYLLLGFLVLWVVAPFLPEQIVGVVIHDILAAVILVFAVVAVSHRKPFLIVASLLAVIAMLAKGAYQINKPGWLSVLGDGSNGLFCVFATVFILYDVLLGERVDFNKICGAICVYFLIGAIWSSAFLVLEAVAPGSFTVAGGNASPGTIGTIHESSLRYHSFITLTTVGYGDIVPVSRAARSLCSLEALVGQLYLAVLVARLVRLPIAGSQLRAGVAPPPGRGKAVD